MPRTFTPKVIVKASPDDDVPAIDKITVTFPGVMDAELAAFIAKRERDARAKLKR